MYTDRQKKRWPLAALLILALLLLLIPGSRLAERSGRKVTEEGAEAIRETVRRSALQCYVVEGVYPPDLQYLEDHYGLRINTEDYYVVYDAFASNQPPDIRVMKRD